MHRAPSLVVRGIRVAALALLVVTLAACGDEAPTLECADCEPPPEGYLLDFGRVPVGTTRTFGFTLENPVPSRVEVAAEIAPPPFEVLSVEPRVVDPGGFTEVVVRFAAPDEGTYDGRLNVTFGTETTVVRMHFEAIVPDPDVACAPLDLDFGTVPAGERREARVECVNRTALVQVLRVGAGEGSHADSFVVPAEPEGIRLEPFGRVAMPVALEASTAGEKRSWFPIEILPDVFYRVRLGARVE